VGVLKLGAVDFDDGVDVFEQDLGCGLDHSGLSGTGRSEKEHSSDGSAGILHSGEEYLIETGNAADRAFLSDYQSAKFIFELFSFRTLLLRIQGYSILGMTVRFFHFIFHSRPRRPIQFRPILLSRSSLWQTAARHRLRVTRSLYALKTLLWNYNTASRGPPRSLFPIKTGLSGLIAFYANGIHLSSV
jgi:hypothetical protein